MPVFVKICGLSSTEAVGAAVDAGADAVGFVFAESPRRVTPARARELCGRLPPGVIRVAVMRHPAPAEWQAVAGGFGPDWLQTDVADFPGLAVAAPVRRLPVFRDTADVDLAAAAAGDLLLFEAADSGQGRQPDWARAAELARRTKLILAGGLTPENVAEAIRTVRPYGVDVSSGVESSRGVKDPRRIAAFVAAVRAAEKIDAS